MALSSSDLKKPFFVQAVYAFKGKHNDEVRIRVNLILFFTFLCSRVVLQTIKKNVWLNLNSLFLQLCFKKGDIITVTQVDNGGWWEGTLDEKTGWFPSNYVKEYKISGKIKIRVILNLLKIFFKTIYIIIII